MSSCFSLVSQRLSRLCRNNDLRQRPRNDLDLERCSRYINPFPLDSSSSDVSIFTLCPSVSAVCIPPRGSSFSGDLPSCKPSIGFRMYSCAAVNVNGNSRGNRCIASFLELKMFGNLWRESTRTRERVSSSFHYYARARARAELSERQDGFVPSTRYDLVNVQTKETRASPDDL